MNDQSVDPKTTPLVAFLSESLAIEGIYRAPTEAEIDSTRWFLRGAMTADTVISLQEVYAPGKPLRDRKGMDVRVGRHIAPPGGEDMRNRLQVALEISDDPHAAHVAFEMLHPFLDGNGRTGRAIWAWKMIRAEEDPFALSFLHRFYYQTLERAEGVQI